jgi:dTDP-4-amino-4,6-dideoxygalactose transaminase
LEHAGIPAMIYYPIPLNEQEAYRAIGRIEGDLTVTHDLCASVLSIPMHTELKDEQIKFITDTIISFFN